MQQQNQQQNKIANPQTGELPQVKTAKMNDRDFVNDGLSTCKYITDSLNIAVREASHQALYNDLRQMLDETHEMTRKMFNLMFEKGWYKLEAADQQKIDKAQKQFSNYEEQFPYPH